MRRFLLPIAALLFAAAHAFASPTEEFTAANKAMIAGEFEQALSGYQDLLDDGHINPDLLYNIGNACYRLERPGEAALWYERTLTMDPTHKEARQNLRFLRRTGGTLKFDDPKFEGFLSNIRRDNLVRIATFSAWLAVLGIAAALTLRLKGGLKNTLWIASPLLALVAIAAATGLLFKHQRQSDLKSRAIVTAPDSKALTAPARASSTVIELPAGSQIASVSSRGKWEYVDMPGDLRGWVPEDAIEPLWPYDAALAD